VLRYHSGQQSVPAGLDWIKSSYSQYNGCCVEIADAGDAVAVRDSKNPHAASLRFTLPVWAEFIAEIKTGALDRPA
jgi:hypothetical protein